MSTTTTHDDKAKKAAAERLRKAKIKAAGSSETVFTYLTDVDGRFCVTEVAEDGTASTVAALTGLTIDEAKEAAKVAPKDGVPAAVAAIGREVTPDPSAKKNGRKNSQPAAPRSKLVEAFPVFAYVAAQYGTTAGDAGAALGVETKAVRAELKKLARRGLIETLKGDDSREVVYQLANADGPQDEAEARTRFDAAVTPRPARSESDGPRSRERKLVHKPTGLIMRMSVSGQEKCIALTGALPVLDGVAFERAE